jgi:hypothetical protein
MSDIPEDVMTAAQAAAYAVEGTCDDGAITSVNGVRVIAKAILAERERIEREGLPGWIRANVSASALDNDYLKTLSQGFASKVSMNPL